MSLGYVIKEGIAGIKRARLAYFTSVFSLFIAILLIGVLARVSFNAYEVANMMKSSIDVEVFLVDLDNQTTQELENELEQQELITELTYISKDSAAAIFKEEFGTEGDALADLQFLPASFRLTINPDVEAEQITALVEEVEQYRGVDEVQFNRQLLELMESRFETVVMAGSGVGLLILFAALILVFNTIRLTIYAKRGLIKAMKLVGATNSFIRRPFLVEGLVQGVVAGGFAVAVVLALFHFIIPQYLPQFSELEWPFGEWYYLSGAMFLLALLMGFLGSLWAARKFIRETTVAE